MYFIIGDINEPKAPTKMQRPDVTRGRKNIVVIANTNQMYGDPDMKTSRNIPRK